MVNLVKYLIIRGDDISCQKWDVGKVGKRCRKIPQYSVEYIGESGCGMFYSMPYFFILL